MTKRKPLSLCAKPDGGLNISASPRDIADNELSAVSNFTFDKDGFSLRPGLACKIEAGFGKIIDVYPKTTKDVVILKTLRNGVVKELRRGIFIAAERAILFFDGAKAERIAKTVRYNGGWVKGYPELNLKDGSFISTGGVTSGSVSAKGETLDVSGENLLFVGSGCFYKISAEAILYQNPSFEPHITAAVTLKEVVGAVPTVFSDCRSDGSGKKTGSRNLLTQKVTQCFTTDSESLIYPLDTDKEIKGEVSLTYRDTEGSLVSLQFSSGATVAVSGNIAAYLDRRSAVLRFANFLCDAKTLKNNLCVTYECKNSRYEEIAGCSLGRYLGNRLYLSGNSDFPDKVYISSEGDFTSFPEELVVSVGKAYEKVTAIGGLFDCLVVFKENSIAAITVNDSKAEATEICGDIGCPGKNALVSFQNHLLWCAAKGVFTLHSTSVKDERAVVCLSEKISPFFTSLSREHLAAASAAAIGKSCLFIIGKKGIILSGENISTSAKTVKWLMWDFSVELTNLFVYNGAFAAADERGNICAFDDMSGRDFGKAFDATLISKAFSMGDETLFKRIDELRLVLSHQETLSFDLNLWFDNERRKYMICAEKDRPCVSVKPAFNRCKTFSAQLTRDKACSEKFGVGNLLITAADISPDGEKG